MNPPCHRCKKTVYPVEKFNCLDKFWHKLCFNCETCSLNLNMKTYKGYNKLPYCFTHYPTTKFTAVADTPENRRLAQSTKQQSSVEYGKEGGSYTRVSADKMDLLRQKAMSKPPPDLGRYATKGPAGQTAPQRPAGQWSPQAPPVVGPVAAPEQQTSGARYIALFDYTAADDDEVSFIEGDVIINGEVIDDVWMTGTNERSGENGMIPSNYLEKQ